MNNLHPAPDQSDPGAAAVPVLFDPSQFPGPLRADLRRSLQTRQVNHKFHYDSPKQTQRWLELHQAYAPSRTDSDCEAVYAAAGTALARQVGSHPAHLFGLGCGGGRKDGRLLGLLGGQGCRVSYSPVDGSAPMTLVAHLANRHLAEVSAPYVCDLATAADLSGTLIRQAPVEATRVVTFFGMLPNFEPAAILTQLALFVRAQDHLLISANLAPGSDYAQGVKRVLPQYDNPLTRSWLLTFLTDLGVEPDDGRMEWTVEEADSGLLRITAWFEFQRTREIRLEGEVFKFGSGERIQLFFSNRFTPGLLGQVLNTHGFQVRNQWITQSGEEGVFEVGRV